MVAKRSIKWLSKNLLPKEFLICDICAYGCLLTVVWISYAQPGIAWDSWAYHLPFGARLWDIRHSSSNFILNAAMEAHWLGFPKVAEWCQGLLWTIFNRVSAASLINSLGLVAIIYLILKATKVYAAVLIFSILAVPQILIHSISTYIDLFFGVNVAALYICAIRLQKIYIESEKQRAVFSAWTCGYVTFSFIVGNTKLWGPIFVGVISLTMLFSVILHFDKRHIRTIDFKRLFLCILISLVLSSWTILKNAYLFHNPIYPLSFSVSWLPPIFSGPIPAWQQYPNYLSFLGWLAKPIYFVLSVTELDWLIRGVKQFYSLDAIDGDTPLRFSPARTGGWWGIWMILNLMALAWIWKRVIKWSGASNFFPIILFAVLTAVTSFMPQSHELRYFLFWPLILLFLVSYGLTLLPPSNSRQQFFLIISMVAFLYNLSCHAGEFPLNGKPEKYFSFVSEYDLVGISENSPEIQKARENGGICLDEKYTPFQFRYSNLFHGGIYLVESSLNHCNESKNFNPALNR